MSILQIVEPASNTDVKWQYIGSMEDQYLSLIEWQKIPWYTCFIDGPEFLCTRRSNIVLAYDIAMGVWSK